MDRYEPAFVQEVDEISFLRYVKNVDDQDILDSLSSMRRRAGLSLSMPGLQVDSGLCESYTEDDNEEDEEDDGNCVTMACYNVQIQSDNGPAIAAQNKQEVSRYAYDETLKQDYLEEFSFIALNEEDDDLPISTEGTHCPRTPSRHDVRSSFLPQWMQSFWYSADKNTSPSNKSNVYDKDGFITDATYSSSPSKSESADFYGTLNALSSVFSGVQ